jgi:hypothetical protein
MHTEHCPVSALVVVEKFGERNCCLLDCLDERRPSSRAELAVSRRERTSGEATRSISEIAENSNSKDKRRALLEEGSGHVTELTNASRRRHDASML